MVIKQLLLTSLLIVSFVASGADGFVVKDIRVEGLQRVALGAALLKIPVRVGDTVTQDEVSEVIRALYSSGHYEDVKVSQDGDALVVQVKERPTIASISFSGNSAIKDEQLTSNLEASGIRVGESLDRTTLNTIEKGLEDFYYSVGKYNASVQAVVTPLPRNRSDLKFVFTEGLSAKIEQINFIGNTVFTDEELLARFDLNVDIAWWNFISDDKYQKQVLAADIESLSSYYLNQGYLKFKVNSTQVAISPDKKGVYITLDLDEGLPYTVRNVQFSGELIDKESEFNRLVPFESGDLYNGSLVTALEEDVKKVLGEAGYAYPKVITVPKFDDENQQVDLAIHLQAGKRIYVRDIRFVGNNLTKDEVLRREMRQFEGTWLNAKSIETSKTRLNRLGFFEKVEVQTIRVPGTDDQVDLVYSVKEANSGSINFGVGYGTDSGLSFLIGFQQENFAGTGDRVALNASRTDSEQNISLEYKDPYWTLDGISQGAKLFLAEYDAADAGIIEYVNNSYGFSVNWGLPVDELNYVGLSAGYAHTEISDLDPDDYLQVANFLAAQADNIDSDGDLAVNDFDATLTWRRNNLDRSYFPTAGNYQSGSYKMTVPGSDVPYYKAQYDVRQYVPLTRKHEFTLLMRGRVGYGNGYGTGSGGHDNQLPFYENFYAGGFTTLRGFSSNSVGPKAVYYNQDTSQHEGTDDAIGGNALWTVSLELIVPTPFASEEASSQIRTSFFVDAGAVWDTEFDYDPSSITEGEEYYYDYSDPSEYRAAAGVAVQWMSPLGPLVFSLAKPVKKYAGDDEEFFSFSIGKTF